MKPNLHWSLLPAYHEKNLRPFIHPSLDRDSLLVYLFKTHVYPAKRIDYKGEAIVLPPLVRDEDWIASIDVREHEPDMAGA